jgi:hypothetical protein
MKIWIITMIAGLTILCLGAVLDGDSGYASAPPEFVLQSCKITNCGDVK